MSWSKLIPATLATALVAALAVAPTIRASEADGGDAVSDVTIVATDHAFELPERVPAGVVRVRLVNEGHELHHAQLIRLDEGKTMEDLGAAMAAGEIPDFVTFAGGPSIVAPGMETSVTLQLRPGTYHWLCFLETPEGTTHVQEGMVRPMVVEPGPSDELPEADNLVILSDYDFRFAQPLTAGHRSIRVRNHAAQPHEIVMVKLMPGKSMDDFMAWVAGGEQGPPPAVPVGGMQALDQGLAANFDVELEPGAYGLVCFVPDVKDMKPHFVHGMVKEITVE